MVVTILSSLFAATVLATTEVEPDSDLEKLRSWIDAFRSEEEDVLRMIPVPTGQVSWLLQLHM